MLKSGSANLANWWLIRMNLYDLKHQCMCAVISASLKFPIGDWLFYLKGGIFITGAAILDVLPFRALQVILASYVIQVLLYMVLYSL